MKIENPFESGHIKNYILAYISIVVIMVLFFAAAQLFNEPKKHPKKKFQTKEVEQKETLDTKSEKQQNENKKSSIRLLEKAF